MPVDDLSVIDLVAINATTGEAMLVIADHLEWDDQNEHLFILQSKINAYLEGIENGSLYEGYPDAKNRNLGVPTKIINSNVMIVGSLVSTSPGGLQPQLAQVFRRMT